ncbi:hypothetical protein FRB91_002622 [Serendipita sp. 411]|nr:hypothetical protein FRB91_002622 [Serendipita sp. 411]
MDRYFNALSGRHNHLARVNTSVVNHQLVVALITLTSTISTKRLGGLFKNDKDRSKSKSKQGNISSSGSGSIPLTSGAQQKRSWCSTLVSLSLIRSVDANIDASAPTADHVNPAPILPLLLGDMFTLAKIILKSPSVNTQSGGYRLLKCSTKCQKRVVTGVLGTVLETMHDRLRNNEVWDDLFVILERHRTMFEQYISQLERPGES